MPIDARHHLQPDVPDLVVLALRTVLDAAERCRRSSAMARLRRGVSTVIWCDPHAAAAGYRPQVQGMRIARQYCDHYLDFSSVASLDTLVSTITR